MPSESPEKPSTQCRCPACTDTPDYTYSEEFRFDCMAREFGHYTPSQLTEFINALKRTAGWKERLQSLEARVEKLKAEGRFDTEYWINKIRTGSEAQKTNHRNLK